MQFLAKNQYKQIYHIYYNTKSILIKALCFRASWKILLDQVYIFSIIKFWILFTKSCASADAGSAFLISPASLKSSMNRSAKNLSSSSDRFLALSANSLYYCCFHNQLISTCQRYWLYIFYILTFSIPHCILELLNYKMHFYVFLQPFYNHPSAHFW